MRYVNPFLLLDIEPGSLFDLPEVIKRRRKELLAQIALDGELMVDDERVDRAAAIRILADLDDARIKRHHERILRNDDLLAFLRFGKCSDVLVLPDKPDSFVTYLEPFLVEKISRALDRGLRSGDGQLISNIVNSKFNFQPESFEKAFRPARTYFRTLSQDLATKNKDLKECNSIDPILPSQCHFDDGESTSLTNRLKGHLRIQPERLFLDSLITSSNITCLNTLPDAFQDIRNEIGNYLDTISVTLFNDHDEEEIALRISELASKICVGGKDHERIHENLRVISTRVYKSRISLTSTRLKIIVGSLRNGNYDSPEEVVSSVLAVFDSQLLNRLSTSSLNSEIIGLTKQIREIGWLVITSFKSTPAALLIVQECMKLRLSDNAVQSALIDKLNETRRGMLESEVEINAIHSKPEVPAASPSRTRAPKQSDVSKEPTPPRPMNFGESVFVDDGLLSSFSRTFSRLTLKDGYRLLAVIGGVFFIAIFVSNLRSSKGILENKFDNRNVQPVQYDYNRQQDLSRFRLAATPASNIARNTPVQSPTPSATRPKTGAVFTRSGGSGLGQLEVSNGLSVDAIVKLRDVASGNTFREFYVRSNEKTTISGIAPGDYEVFFATGVDFVPVTKRFASGGNCEKFNHTFAFTQVRESGGVRYKVTRVTLDKVPNGQLGSSSVDPADFYR